jgi:hypothetical protein
LIGRANYHGGVIYVLRALNHVEYDKKRWIEDCGCHKPPPKKPAAAKASPKGKPASQGRNGKR